MREYVIVPADDFAGDRNDMQFGPLMICTVYEDGSMVAEADGVTDLRSARVAVGLLKQRDAALLERMESFWT